MLYIDYINIISENKFDNRSMEKISKEMRELIENNSITIIINNKKIEMVE